MAEPTYSFKQFNYSLRPSKQVERKVMIEILLRLSIAGYTISDYTYLGFGSPFYVDFVMFHKYLFMSEMICVEWGQVRKRMTFNKPFKFIKLWFGALSAHIPRINLAKPYLVWLDYDRSLDSEMLQDIDGCLNRLGRKSIFVVTIDARPKLPPDEFDFDLSDLRAEQRERLTVEKYTEWFGRYVSDRITRNTIAGDHVSPLFYEAIIERIKQTLATRRSGLHFIQLFNYVYKDGAPMFTLGGMVGNDEDQAALTRAGIFQHRFVRTGSDGLEISVPPLTVREKYWLDKYLDKELTSAKLQFELDQELLDNYRTFYREYPTYLETLL